MILIGTITVITLLLEELCIVRSRASSERE